MAISLASLVVTLKPLNRSFSFLSAHSRLNHSISASSLRFNSFRRRKILTVCFVVEGQKQTSPMDDKPESTTTSSEKLATSRLLQKAERKKSERFTYLIAAVMSSFGITSMAIMAVYYRFSWQMKTSPMDDKPESTTTSSEKLATSRLLQKAERKKSERFTYLIAAVMSSFGITSMAIMAVYYRFSWQMKGGVVPLSEMFGTFALSVGAAVGMEFWARWAHRALWHASLWNMHESHHKPREGAFELNDVFAIINAIPAIGLLYYGFFNKGLVPGLCFGAGLGITVFGMAYMFVHDGLVHKRFPVGPIANVPYLRKVAAAHQLHHTDKFMGVPYGLFLGHKEVEEVGGKEELEKEINRRIKLYNKESSTS